MRKLFYYINNVGFTATFFRVIARILGYAMRMNSADSIVLTEPLVLLNGRKFIVNPDDKGFSLDIVLGNGVREPLVSRYLVENLPKMKTFFDLGANIGYYTILLEDKFEKIIAVEPLSENLHYFQQNIEINNLMNKVISRHAAVSGKSGKVKISDNIKKNWAKIGEEGVLVDAMNLDDFTGYYGKINFMKMDVEGYEKEIILSNPAWWRENGPEYFFFELHIDIFEPEVSIAILKVLDDAGYYIEIAFYEINPVIHWSYGWLNKVHMKILEYALRPREFIMYKKQSITDVYTDKLVLDGSYGAIEFVLRKLS